MVKAQLNQRRSIELRRRVVETATAIIDQSLGITAGARLLREYAFDLGAQWDDAFVVIVGVDSETDAFPLGSVRERWSPAALDREDRVRQEYEDRVRSRMNQACAELIRRYQWPSGV
jgi:hypothetical protein